MFLERNGLKYRDSASKCPIERYWQHRLWYWRLSSNTTQIPPRGLSATFEKGCQETTSWILEFRQFNQPWHCQSIVLHRGARCCVQTADGICGGETKTFTNNLSASCWMFGVACGVRKKQPEGCGELAKVWWLRQGARLLCVFLGCNSTSSFLTSHK